MNGRSALVVAWCVASVVVGSVRAGDGPWVQTGGPPGGAMDVAIGDGSGTIYAAVDGVLLRSDDAGETFDIVGGSGLPAGAARPVLLVSEGDSTGRAGGAVFAVVATSPDAAELLVSMDAGEAWSSTGLASFVDDVADVRMVAWNDDVLAYVKTAGADMLLRSDDLGATWTTLFEDFGTGFGVRFVALSDGIISTRGGISRSTDGGASWEVVSDNIPVFNVWSLVAASEAALIVRGAFGNATYRSFNDGASWSSMVAVGTENEFNPSVALPDSALLMPHVNGVYRSENNGSNWTLLPAPGLPAGPVSELTSLGGEMVLASVSSGPFISAEAGESWSFIGDAYTGTSVARVGAAGDVLFATTSGTPHTFRSSDAGQSWHETAFQLSLFPIEMTDEVDADTATILATTATHGAFTSGDGGATWNAANTGLPTILEGDEPIFEPLNAAVRVGDALFVGTGGATIHVHDGSHCSCSSTTSGQGVFRSVNGGASWQSTSSGLPINTFDTGGTILRPIAHLVAAGDTVLAGTPHHGIYRSTNLGLSWTATTGLPTGIESELVDLEVAGETIYALTAAGLYRSETDGVSWALVNDAIGFGDIAVLDSALYAGGTSDWFKEAGVFRSDDGGATWESVGAPLDGMIVHAVTASQGAIFAGTHGQGVWKHVPGGETLFGDLDGSGGVDEVDRAVLCAALGASLGDAHYNKAADFDGSGSIDHVDQIAFNDVLPPCAGDAVSSETFAPPADGLTDGADLAFLLGAWAGGPSCADFVTSKSFAPPPDGHVDGADLAYLLGAWGTCE